MTSPRIMPWIDELPGARITNFPARRDRIAALLEEANELARKAEALRDKAYIQGCVLEGEAKGKWSMDQVEHAKFRTGWK